MQTGGKIHGVSDDAHYSPDNDWAYHKWIVSEMTCACANVSFL